MTTHVVVLIRQFEETADTVGISKDAALDEALTAWIGHRRDGGLRSGGGGQLGASAEDTV